MINSILEYSNRRIILDRIVTRETNGEISITTDPDAIKLKVKQHLQEWTQGNKGNILMTEFWKKQFLPKKDIKTTYYSNVTEEITEEELAEYIRNLSNNKTPGPSQIPYEVFKHLETKTLQWLTNFFNEILRTGKTPREWSKGHVILIPKPKDWEGQLEITRPITLMETTRKLFTKIINNRLAQTLADHKILNKSNQAGIPGGRTVYPIHILNNIMEEAREEKKELWLLFQDISKAFDSVNNEMMITAMKRLKISKNIIEIIRNIINEK